MKKAESVPTKGYKNPATIQNMHPPIMAHFRPRLSVIHPLKGLAISALIENAGIIHPKYSLPFNLLRKSDNSGKTILNDKKKKSAPQHIIQKCFG